MTEREFVLRLKDMAITLRGTLTKSITDVYVKIVFIPHKDNGQALEKMFDMIYEKYVVMPAPAAMLEFLPQQNQQGFMMSAEQVREESQKWREGLA